MKHHSLIFIFLSCIMLVLSNCTSFLPQVSPTLSPTPPISSPTSSTMSKCILDTWSYDENIHTQITIAPDLKITLRNLGLYKMVITATPVGGQFPTLPAYQSTDTTNPFHPGSITTKISIFGDGRAILVKEQDQKTILEREKQIPIDQLQKIIAILEEVNFYAISWGCGDKGMACPCGTELDISVETKENVHQILDHGMCDSRPFNRYCDLFDRIVAIIGEFD
jgi:hypothetical protein